MNLALRRKLLSPKEYLQVERNSDYRSEYDHGELFVMPAGDRVHNSIEGKLRELALSQPESRNWVVLDRNTRIAVDPGAVYTYADVCIVRGEPIFIDEPERDNLTNPCVVFEVYSPETEDYDRGQKFEHYKRIPSLAGYGLVAQDRPLVEQFHRGEDGAWHSRIYSGLDTIVELDSVGCRLPLAGIYEQV